MCFKIYLILIVMKAVFKLLSIISLFGIVTISCKDSKEEESRYRENIVGRWKLLKIIKLHH